MQFRMIPGSPTPVAPFSHAVETDGLVFVTGQMPDTPAAPGVVPDGVAAQTRAVMENLRTILGGLGLGFEHVVMARITLTRFQPDYSALNGTWRGYFAEGRLPAAPASASPASPMTPCWRSISWRVGRPEAVLDRPVVTPASVIFHRFNARFTLI